MKTRECTIILLGATGDLARRKLIPAIYKLIKSNYFEKFLFVGVALEESSLQQIFDNAQEFIQDYDPTIIDECLRCGCYQQLDISQEQDFEKLATTVTSLEQEHGLNGNRLVYCAIPSPLFVPVTQHLTAVGILTCKENKTTSPAWQRIVYEKPFGYDAKSAQEMYTEISTCLDDSQLYIIDHYLAKEIVGNIALVRFTNRVFELLWNHNNIESVTIKLNEKLDVSKRVGFFEQFGVLRDVVQNHMFQLLALIGMEEPTTLTGDDIRIAKAELLSKVRFKSGYLGQYEGYKQHKGVTTDSEVATYANLTLEIENERWKGVPFHLITGKCLKEKETAIYIKFKPVKCLLTKKCPSDQNELKISIVPRAGFSLELNAKKVGTTDEVMPVEMEYCHECIHGLYTPMAYEVIIQEVIEGMRAISVSHDELMSSWRLIDEVVSKKLPVYTYECGSTGPKNIKE